jgi:hypothetical protein
MIRREDRGWKVEDRRWRIEDRGWKMEFRDLNLVSCTIDSLL